MPRRVTTRAISASVVVTTLMLAAGLSGCGNAETSASLMADAKQYQQKGDNKAALIQLKNAASKNPEDAEVRFQLASLYNQLGDAVSAEKEIRKAISLGFDGARAGPELVKALLVQGKAKNAIDETDAAAAKAGPELLAARGDAYFALNDAAKAKDSYLQAIAAKPEFAGALIGMARLALIEKDGNAADRYTQQAVSANPKSTAVWFFKGSLLGAEGKTEGALAAYGQVLALQPDHVNARIERAHLELAAGKFDAAKADIDAARKAAPNALTVIYTQAVLDYKQGKFAAAHESLQKVLRVAPEHMQSILLAGAVEMNLGTLEQAEQHLKKYLEKYPNDAFARKLLAQTLMKSSQPAGATAALAPLLKDGSEDAQLLALAGQSSMQGKDFNKAAAYFEKASALSPKTASLHTSLGLSKLGQGDAAKGISELEMAAALDPASQNAGLALVQAELSLKHFDKALAAVEALEKNQPNNASVQYLKGGVYMAKGDLPRARASFEKSSSLQANFMPPVVNLAQMDLREKKPEAAKKRFEAFLQHDKKNAGAMQALAEIAVAEGHPEQATPWLEKASAENPEAIAPAIKLGSHYLGIKQPEKALTLARKFQATNPSNPELLDLLGQAQLANKDYGGALETYSKLVNVLPKSALVQSRLAGVHMLMKNEPAAVEDLKRAIALQPDFLPAYVGQMELAMRKGNSDEAIALARQVQKLNAKSPVGFAYEGDLQSKLNRPAPALAAYEKAFALAKSPQLMVKIAQLMKQAGKAKEADTRLDQWRQANPSDQLVPMYQAETYLAAKQYKQAAETLRVVTKLNPDNPVALNNLAWAYQQDKDPRALETAEHAARVSPDSPAVMDTLGWLLVEQGDAKRAVPYLQKAVSLAPAAPELRFHLASALNKSGDKLGARKELEKLLSSNSVFPQIEDAKALLKIL